MTGPDSTSGPPEPMPLTGLLDGFGGYFEPASELWDEVLRRGLVVLDTSAILDAYRMSPHARTEFLQVLEKLHDRLFVPHQVAREFHRRRIDAVEARREDFGNLAKTIKDCTEKTKKALAAHAEGAHPDADRVKGVAEALTAAFAEAQALVTEMKKGYDLDPSRIVRGVDPVLERLVKILDGRVNSRPSDQQLQEDRAESCRRRELKIPPGFGDSDKDDPDGDYLWWAEVVRHAATDRRPVLVVTNDVTKGDWTYDLRGTRIGAHPRLVEEIRREADVPLLLATVSELLTKAKSILDADVDDSTLREVNALAEREVDPAKTLDSVSEFAALLSDVRRRSALTEHDPFVRYLSDHLTLPRSGRWRSPEFRALYQWLIHSNLSGGSSDEALLRMWEVAIDRKMRASGDDGDAQSDGDAGESGDSARE